MTEYSFNRELAELKKAKFLKDKYGIFYTMFYEWGVQEWAAFIGIIVVIIIVIYFIYLKKRKNNCDNKTNIPMIKNELHSENKNLKYSTITVDENLLIENDTPNKKDYTIKPQKPNHKCNLTLSEYIKYKVNFEKILTVFQVINGLILFFSAAAFIILLIQFIISSLEGNSTNELKNNLSQSASYVLISGIPLLLVVIKKDWEWKYTIRLLILNIACILISAFALYPAFNLSDSKPKVSSVSASDTVYVTKSGKKYHSSKDCAGLSNAGKIYSREFEEVEDEYEPCEICWNK